MIGILYRLQLYVCGLRALPSPSPTRESRSASVLLIYSYVKPHGTMVNGYR